MSLKFTEIKIEKKPSISPYQNKLKENNNIFQANKSNHILIDDTQKDLDNNGENKSKYKLISNYSNIDRNKFVIKNHYEIESNSNESKHNGNGLRAVNNKKNMEEGKLSQTFKNENSTVKSLKMKVNELNGEINKLKNDSNNYNILENNYKQKTKELTDLKQENNYIRFQLEDLRRKNKSNNNIKNNNFISSNNSKKKQTGGGMLGHVKDYHIKLFSKKIGEEDNKEKNTEGDEIDEYIKKNEELKKKNETINKELDRLKKSIKFNKE